MAADALQSRLQRLLGDGLTIERELGGGGMARVFLATERALDRRVVVKALDLEVAVPAAADRFRREIKVVAQLHHPHIVPVFTAGGDDSLLWYTMPFVSGESLRARLTRGGALPVGDAVRIAREVLDALGAAHGRGIVHRDIKPDNILLVGDHAQVADFGVAKALTDAGVGSTYTTTSGIALGTPAYMAPEQAMADPTTDHRADLYALGVVLYELLTGTPPFSGSAPSVVAAHLTTPVPPIASHRSEVPAPVTSLVMRLLAKLPADRPQSAAEAIATLDGMTGAAMSPAPSRRRWAVRGGVGVLAVLAIGATAWWSTSAARAPDFAGGTEVIAILPFSSTGDSALARLGRDLIITLGANIDGIGTVRTVDPMSVLQRAAGLPQPLPLDAAQQLAKSLGATYLVHGAIIGDAGGVRVDATLHDVRDGQTLARFGARHDAMALRELTDSLSSDLLRQIWRSGTPPSPMLADAATPSGDALRAFLEGEEAFEQAEYDRALRAYGRATELDSNFVQAWLRKEHVRYSAVFPPDSTVRRRLDALAHRMPLRDRALRISHPPEATFEQRLAALESVAARFPESHLAQYFAGDMIIHFGPMHGVPVARAIPYLDRLDSLAPRHADNAHHRWMVSHSLGDTTGFYEATQRLTQLVADAQRSWAQSLAHAPAAYRTSGQLVDGATAILAFRAALDGMRALPIIAEVGLMVTAAYAGPPQLDSAFAAIAGDVVRLGYERQYLLALGSLQFSRGDVGTALGTFSRLEQMDAPAGVRTAGVRGAATAAWLGLIPLADAEAAAAASRRALGNGSADVMLDVQWSEAVLAIAARDSSRFVTAIGALDDTSSERRLIARGLRALWREKVTGLVDSLIAHDDHTMRTESLFLPTVPLTRLAIGRSLTMSGDLRRAEHYLQWIDGKIASGRAVQLIRSLTPYTSYQRGLAAEAAGDRRAAILHLRRFVDQVDRPPQSLSDQLTDARNRLSRLLAVTQ